MKRKFSTAATAAALVAGASANVAFTNSDFTVEEGKPFKLTWAGASGAVNITLATGASKDLKVIQTIDST